MKINLSQLWTLEAIGIVPFEEPLWETAEYQQHSIEFRDNGYYAKLPWRSVHPELPTNFLICRNMTRSTVRRLALKEMIHKYQSIIKQHLERGYIEAVPQSEIGKRNCHYIPHHYVTKDSVTTPIRIVFNCSCKSRNGVSLNDCLKTGPSLHNNMLSIIIRFRVHPYGITADVEKAFHHIGLHKEDRDFLRLLWIKDVNNQESEFIVYRFRVIPFGANSSPFILNATVIKHLESINSPVALDMKPNIFVDNLITGCETEEQCLNYYKEANRIMEKANLPHQSRGSNSQLVQETAARSLAFLAMISQL